MAAHAGGKLAAAHRAIGAAIDIPGGRQLCAGLPSRETRLDGHGIGDLRHYDDCLKMSHDAYIRRRRAAGFSHFVSF